MRLISVRSEGDDAAKLLWDSGTAGIGVEASVFVVPEEHRVHTDAVEPLRSRHGVVCISSQVGCSVGCSFCATGRLGRLRNLDVLEMLQQAREGAQRLPNDVSRSVTFSGMGEPLQNLRAVVETAETLCNEGFDYASLSTIGIPMAIDRLRELRPATNLFVSLHAATDEQRRALVRSPSCFPVADVVGAAERYAKASRKLVKISWLLLPGVNDSGSDAHALARMLDPDLFLVQVLLWNEVKGMNLRRVSRADADAFAERLNRRGCNAYVMESHGQDLDAACGQLAGRLDEQ